MKRVALVASAIVVASVTLVAQQILAPQQPAFRSAIALTTVTATVTNRDGELVTGLPQDAFDVYDDGELQTISQFTNERVPVSLDLLLDVSDSMYGRRIEDAREAVERFVGDMMERGDEYSIVAFNHRQYRLIPWTADGAAAPGAMQSLRPFGSTAIYDAVLSALPMLAVRNRQRAALLIISDGADTASDAPLREVRSALLRTDAFLYSIAIDPPDRRPINVPVNVAALKELTDQSGGRTMAVRNSAEVSGALAEIANELNSQYLIGYIPNRAPDGQYHSIRVRVRSTDYRVRARNGYVAEAFN